MSGTAIVIQPVEFGSLLTAGLRALRGIGIDTPGDPLIEAPGNVRIDRTSRRLDPSVLQVVRSIAF